MEIKKSNTITIIKFLLINFVVWNLLSFMPTNKENIHYLKSQSSANEKCPFTKCSSAQAQSSRSHSSEWESYLFTADWEHSQEKSSSQSQDLWISSQIQKNVQWSSIVFQARVISLQSNLFKLSVRTQQGENRNVILVCFCSISINLGQLSKAQLSVN